MEELPVELKIEKFAKNGDGLAIYQDAKVEIAHVIPEDYVKVLLRRKRRRKRKGKLLSVISPSPSRILPKCIHAEICGGCNWQIMKYEEQLKEKQKIVETLFIKQGSFSKEKIRPIIPAQKEWFYRNKMEFSFSENRAKTKFLGLMIARMQNYVFNLTECSLANPWMAKLLCRIRNFWEASILSAYHPIKNEGLFKTLTLREAHYTKEKMIILTVNDLPPEQTFLEEFIKLVQEELQDNPAPFSIYLRKQKSTKGTPTTFEEILLFGPEKIQEKMVLPHFTFTFNIGPSSFFQPNLFQAEKIYSEAIKMFDEKFLKESVVYDFYSGTGTLGLAFAKIVKKVIGIEINPEAVKDSFENQRLNHIKNFEMFSGDVEKILENHLLPSPDILVLDPPREGVRPKALQMIKNLKPNKILYISCNPYTQLQNILDLCQSGYCLKTIQPVDHFPHTVHIETIALLEQSI